MTTIKKMSILIEYLLLNVVSLKWGFLSKRIDGHTLVSQVPAVVKNIIEPLVVVI